MWPSALSGRLPIDALVGRYPANRLIGRGSIVYRIAPFRTRACAPMRLCGISTRFRVLSPCIRQVPHALLTRPPLGCQHFRSQQAGIFKNGSPVRLACVRHAASVHPEPGSNSRTDFRFSRSRTGLACSQSFFTARFVTSVLFSLNFFHAAGPPAASFSFSESFRVALLSVCQGAKLLRTRHKTRCRPYVFCSATYLSISLQNLNVNRFF